MRSLVVLSMLITTVVTLTVGVRLLLAARRTRQIPELLYGTAFVATAVGQVFPQIGQRLLWSDPGVLATTLNTLFFGIFVSLAAYGLRIVDGDFAVSVAPSRGLLAHYAIRILLLGWVCFEAFRWHALLRRRLKLGLADPVATNQILLWGISGVAAVVPALVIVLSLFVLHVHPLEWWPALSAIMLSVFVVSGGMWCAFFPPAWLRTSLEQRALG